MNILAEHLLKLEISKSSSPKIQVPGGQESEFLVKAPDDTSILGMFIFFQNTKIKVLTPKDDDSKKGCLWEVFKLHLGCDLAGNLIWGLPTYRTVRNKFFLFINYPVYGILL